MSESLAPSWPTRRHYAAAAFFFLAVAVYGSLVPLNFVALSPQKALEQFTTDVLVPKQQISRTDLVVNVFLFVPIGYCFLATLTLGPSRRNLLFGQMVLVLAACAAASFVIEFAQLWFDRRTSSLYDIIAQTAGTSIGIGLWLVAGRTVHDWLRSLRVADRQQDLLDWLLKGYLAGLILYSMRQLDLTIRPAELKQKYRAGRVTVRPFSEAEGIELWLEFATTLAVYVPVGMLAATLLTSARRPIRSLPTAVLMGWMMLTSIFFGQLLVVSHHSKTTDLISGAVGVLIGAFIMHWWKGGRNLPRQSEPSGRGGAVWLLLAAALYAAVLFVMFCAPFDVITDSGLIKQRLNDFFRPPLSSLYHGSIFNAVKEVVRKAGLFAPLGVLLTLFAMRIPAAGPMRRILFAAAFAAAAGVALSIEIAQVVLRGHVSDLTDVVLCATGAAVGMFFAHRRAAR